MPSVFSSHHIWGGAFYTVLLAQCPSTQHPLLSVAHNAHFWPMEACRKDKPRQALETSLLPVSPAQHLSLSPCFSPAPHPQPQCHTLPTTPPLPERNTTIQRKGLRDRLFHAHTGGELRAPVVTCAGVRCFSPSVSPLLPTSTRELRTPPREEFIVYPLCLTPTAGFLAW
jgi:hypothetical protein